MGSSEAIGEDMVVDHLGMKDASAEGRPRRTRAHVARGDLFVGANDVKGQ